MAEKGFRRSSELKGKDTERKSDREREAEAQTSTMASGWDPDTAQQLLAFVETCHKNEEVNAMIEEREKKLESSKERVKETQEELKRQEEYRRSLHKVRDAEQAELALLQMQEERLKEEYATLVERKKEMQKEIERNSVYKEFLEQLLKMTEFKDVSELVSRFESILDFNKHLLQKNATIHQQLEEMRKEKSTLEDQQHFERLHGIMELTRLQAELDRETAEKAKWDKEWNFIEETERKETLLLAEIHMAVENLHEQISGQTKSDGPLDIKDPEKQLDQVFSFLKEQNDRYQDALQRQKDGEGQKQSREGQSSQVKGKNVNVKGGKGLKKGTTFKK